MLMMLKGLSEQPGYRDDIRRKMDEPRTSQHQHDSSGA